LRSQLERRRKLPNSPTGFRKLEQNRKSDDDDDDDAVYTNCVVKAHQLQTVKLTMCKYKS